jgi:exopolysaccharide production protein ExoY
VSTLPPLPGFSAAPNAHYVNQRGLRGTGNEKAGGALFKVGGNRDPMTSEASSRTISSLLDHPHTPRFSSAADRRRGTRPVGGRVKRLMDLGMSLVASLILIPILLLIGLLIRVLMGGPVIFAHPRIGREGNAFRCYKFRTMIADGDAVLQQYLNDNPEALREWRVTRKLTSDPRITWFGRILRKSSLDELPQLINVIRGDMSVVGPRPIVAEELSRYGSYSADYLRARPGLTGLWQVSGRSGLSYERRIDLDRYYVRRWSIALDLAIVLKTLPALLRYENTA